MLLIDIVHFILLNTYNSALRYGMLYYIMLIKNTTFLSKARLVND